MATAKSENVLFERGQDGSEGENDLWDDTALIKAYDEAVSLMKVQVAQQNGEPVDEILPAVDQSDVGKAKKKKKKKSQNRSKNKRQKWKVGDRCRAIFSEDGLIYKAEVVSIDEKADTCYVRFVDYGNEEEVSLNDLIDFGPQTGSGRKPKLESEVETDSGMEWKGASPAARRRPDSANSGTSQPPRMPWGAGFRPPMPAFQPPPMPFSFPGMPAFPHPGLSQSIPPIPPPPPPVNGEVGEGDNEALCSMLMSWYMSGYHTGHYQGLKQGRQNIPR